MSLTVEIGFEGDAGVRFQERSAGWAKMNAIIFGAGLEEDARWLEGGEGEGREEVAEECR